MAISCPFYLSGARNDPFLSEERSDNANTPVNFPLCALGSDKEFLMMNQPPAGSTDRICARVLSFSCLRR